MENTISGLIYELSLRVRLLRASRESSADPSSNLSRREELILEIVGLRGQSSVSSIRASYPSVTLSAISSAITTLWKRKLVEKHADPDDQRVTLITLSKKGREVLAAIRKDQKAVLGKVSESLNLTPEQEALMKSILARSIDYFDKRLSAKP